jgi:lipoprotein signal peptidase
MNFLKSLDWDDFGAALGMMAMGLTLLVIALFILFLYLALLVTHPFIWLLVTVIVAAVVGGALGLMYLDKKHEWYLF